MTGDEELRRNNRDKVVIFYVSYCVPFFLIYVFFFKKILNVINYLITSIDFSYRYNIRKQSIDEDPINHKKQI